MQINGLVPSAYPNAQPGIPQGPNVSQGRGGELLVTELLGRYAQGSQLGIRYGGANQAAVATTAAFATTYTGLVLYNPPGSVIQAQLEKVGIGQLVAQTSDLILGIMVGQSSTALSGVTALTPKSKKQGSGLSAVCGLASAATLPVAPTLDTVLGYAGTGAITVSMTNQELVDLGGDIILLPGAFAALYTSSASVAASLIASFQWTETPYP
jgi:hypothetical protein